MASSPVISDERPVGSPVLTLGELDTNIKTNLRVQF